MRIKQINGIDHFRELRLTNKKSKKVFKISQLLNKNELQQDPASLRKPDENLINHDLQDF